MPVRSVTKDPKALTLTVVAEFPVPVERVWAAWTDPRQLERFWGPPQWPATFVTHDFVVGGKATYYMTGPDGTKSSGWWRFVRIDPPRSFEIEDGFADENGNPNAEMPTTKMRISLEAIAGGGTRMTGLSTFPSLEAMERLVAMGVEEGLEAALGQMDAVLGV
jgi:uncharacterized protein YndB with AHSA1/START domain